MIILCPELARAWTRAGKLEPITSPINSKFPGRMIGLTPCFPNKLNRSNETYHRKAKGVIKLFLCSIYHQHNKFEQNEFYDELDQFITNRPRNSEILMGADIKCNVGITSKRLINKLGSQGINNRNIKERELLYLYKTNNLKQFYRILSITITLHTYRFTTRSQHTCWTISYDVINYSKESVATKS